MYQRQGRRDGRCSSQCGQRHLDSHPTNAACLVLLESPAAAENRFDSGVYDGVLVRSSVGWTKWSDDILTSC